MKRNITTTSDGSNTIHLVEWDEHYHSRHGAIREAYHVFIDQGLAACSHKSLHILEMGFGTGLNALITLIEASARSIRVTYTGVDAFPVAEEEVLLLNYIEVLEALPHKEDFKHMHTCPWETPQKITDYFTLIKRRLDFREVCDNDSYDLIYYDAFGARVQPELWTEPLFERMFQALKTPGILVTYAAKGSVRRSMQAVGFTVERLPGPPGKREMLRAVKGSAPSISTIQASSPEC